MKRLLAPLAMSMLSFFVPHEVQAQFVKPDTLSHWKKKLVFNFNINQAAFSSNWKAGGINSIGLNGAFNYRLNYSKDRISWDNTI